MTRDRDEDRLEAALAPFFDAAQAEAGGGVPGQAGDAPEALMAQILAQAAAEQPHPRGAPAPRPAPSGLSGLAGVLATLGGWPAAAGLAAVAGVGVMMGLSPPALLDTALEGAPFLSGLETDSTATMLVSYDAFLDSDG